MNDLKILTQPTRDPKTFDVFWMTGLIQKGRIEVVMQFEESACVAAELSAIHYLLTTKNACGHDKAGAGLRIVVSRPEILPLLTGSADDGRMARYASFLRTRFLGAVVTCDEESYDWAGVDCDRLTDYLRVYDAPQTTIDVPGIGQVELTAHAVAQYVERFGRPPTAAWRDLRRIAQDLKPMHFKRRSVFSDIKHRQPGIHLVSMKRELVAVISRPDGAGRLPRLSTVFLADQSNIQVRHHQAPSLVFA